MKSSEQLQRCLWAAAAAVVAWRLLSLVLPHPADTDPEPVRLAMTPLGLWFLACGLWAWRRSPSRASRLLAWYGVSSGLHWGGPIGLGPEPARNLLLATYIVLGTAVGQSLFLHLALAFPIALRAARHRAVLALVYAPPVAGGLLLAAFATTPSSRQLLAAFGIFFPIGTLYSLAGGALWIGRLLFAGPEERRRGRLTLVVTALLAGFIPHALVASGLGIWPRYDGLVNLAMGLVPAALALAVSGGERRGAPPPESRT